MYSAVDANEYRKKLKNTLKDICFDRASGESFPFEKLFYPLEVDEGKHAFQRYSEQMNHAKKIAEKRLDVVYPIADTRSSDSKEKQFANDILSAIRQAQGKLSNDKEQEKRDEPTRETQTQHSDNENKSEIEKIKEKIAQAQSAWGSTNKSQIHLAEKQPATDWLFEDSECDHSSLIIDGQSNHSRILAIASAGHGKTTLLRRVALYYCDSHDDPPKKSNESAENIELYEKYNLSGNCIPCIIKLRDISDNNYSIDKAIEKSVIDVFRSSENNGEIEPPQISEVDKWILSNKTEFLLLIDGLDELSDSMRLNFLRSLDDYLISNPSVKVIMTSRVAGLSESGVKEILQKMGFHGRSIIPLTDSEAQKYSQKWIDITQPEEQKSALNDAVAQILNQNRFKYLREFMRTPLELLVILKQLANDTLSLNRFQMFHDMLWELFTNHVKRYDQKRPVFDDTMTLLSFLAYQMQLNDSLFISEKEIIALYSELSHLSFHTDIMSANDTVDYLGFLDSLAANVGIVEKDDRNEEKIYTFPIRAYQEFLTAHACCHLRLNLEQSRPDPCTTIIQHVNDTRWSSITNFALSDLATNNQSDFDTLILSLFEKVSDIEQLRQIVEADLAITRTHAQVLCDNLFTQEFISDEQKDFIVACMNTKSSYAYLHVLKNSFQSTPDSVMFLEATSIATIAWEYNAGHSAFDTASKNIQNGTETGAKLGAVMVLYLAKSCLEEELCEYTNKAKADIRISNDVLAALYSNALLYKDAYSAEALATLWLTKNEGYTKVKALLDADLASVIINEIEGCKPVIRNLCLNGKKISKAAEYKRVCDLFYALGTIPVTSSNKSLLSHSDGDVFVSTLLQAMYENSKDDVDVDQVALSIACLYYCWDIEKFTQAWGADVCKGMPSEFVRKDVCSIREQNHFDLVKKQLVNFENRYREKQQNEANTLTSSTSKVFSLFRARKIEEAAQYCFSTLGKEPVSNQTNLAFLMRYGKIDPKSIGDGRYTVTSLLKDGVQNREHYALINMALFELNEGNYEKAAELVSQIDSNGWHDVSENFWLTELWKVNHDPEGALVCVLAHEYGKCDFEDYDEMIQVVRKKYSDIPKTLIK